MESIIVTVTDLKKSFLYDLELPVDIPQKKLTEDIVEALNGYDPALGLSADGAGLYCNRTGKRLGPDETLESAGVWNGDYVTILEVK